MSNAPTWYIIANPTSGNGRAKKHWPRISGLLEKAQVEFEMVFTEETGHATELCAAAIKAGYRKVVALGGDGTANEVMNGIFSQQEIPSTDVSFAVIPVGTGNDWIKSHKIPKNYRKAIEIIRAGKTGFQDIGLVSFQKDGKTHQRYFQNVAGLAYDAFVARVANEKRNLVTNQIFYFYLIFKCLSQYTPQHLRVSFDDEVVEDTMYSINVGICKYSGGGMQFVPHAVPDDGQLALTIIRSVPKWQVITNTPRFYNGKLEKHPRITTHFAKKITIEGVGGDQTDVEVDGESLGIGPVEFSIIEKAFKIVIPS